MHPASALVSGPPCIAKLGRHVVFTFWEVLNKQSMSMDMLHCFFFSFDLTLVMNKNYVEIYTTCKKNTISSL